MSSMPYLRIAIRSGPMPNAKPLKRAGGRRYYRPRDIEILRAIKHLLYGQGYTIKGVQRVLKEQGAGAFAAAAWVAAAGFAAGACVAAGGGAAAGDGEAAGAQAAASKLTNATRRAADDHK